MNEAFSDRAWHPHPRLGWVGDLLPCRGAHTAVPGGPRLAAGPRDAVGSRLYPTANPRQGQNASSQALTRGLLFMQAGAFFRARQQLQRYPQTGCSPFFSGSAELGVGGWCDALPARRSCSDIATSSPQTLICPRLPGLPWPASLRHLIKLFRHRPGRIRSPLPLRAPRDAEDGAGEAAARRAPRPSSCAGCCPGAACPAAKHHTGLGGLEMGLPQPRSPQYPEPGPAWPQGLLATTHDYHPADVAAAELGVGRVMHVRHPAAHEDAQPHHQQVFHLDAWEATLEGKENAGEGRGSARVGSGWTRTTSSIQTNLSIGETFSLFYIYSPVYYATPAASRSLKIP